MKRSSLWFVSRLCAILFAISGLAVQSSIAWAQSLEVADRDKTQVEVAKRVEQLVHETAQHDPELAREIERQKGLVIHEMKHGQLNDTNLIHDIENFRTVQRELAHRVARAEAEYRITEVAADNPALAHQLRAAFETWRNADGKETFAWFERGEGIHHLSPEGLERVQRETERFAAEHPDKANYAQEFFRREFERARPESREHDSMESFKHARQAVEGSRAERSNPEGLVKVHHIKNRDVNDSRDLREVERARGVATREVDRVREAPTHEIERIREAPPHEVERVREAPTHEIERIREAPPHEVERAREAPRSERSTERAENHTNDRNDQRLDGRQKTSRKR